MWSFVHVDDAATATQLAIESGNRHYNIVDDDPAEVSVWLPELARVIGASAAPYTGVARPVGYGDSGLSMMTNPRLVNAKANAFSVGGRACELATGLPRDTRRLETRDVVSGANARGFKLRAIAQVGGGMPWGRATERPTHRGPVRVGGLLTLDPLWVTACLRAVSPSRRGSPRVGRDFHYRRSARCGGTRLVGRGSASAGSGYLAATN